MEQVIQPGEVPEEWSADALYAKALRYAEKMNAEASDSWEHVLWSALCLEVLARAALANLSPVLLADPSKWQNLPHALGFPPFETKFSPTSIATSAVLSRLRSLMVEFDSELESFCITHTGRRNQELHSGALAFDGMQPSKWHGKFYRAAVVLLGSMGLTLSDFVGSEEAETAEKEIEAELDAAAKSVAGEVAAHEKVWNAKGADEQESLARRADLLVSRNESHRVVCPACGSKAAVVGEAIGEPTRSLDEEDNVTERQEHLPHLFECSACGLKIVGLSRLLQVGLGDRYARTEVYSAAEYYAADDPYAGFDDDNNEPF